MRFLILPHWSRWILPQIARCYFKFVHFLFFFPAWIELSFFVFFRVVESGRVMPIPGRDDQRFRRRQFGMAGVKAVMDERIWKKEAKKLLLYKCMIYMFNLSVWWSSRTGVELLVWRWISPRPYRPCQCSIWTVSGEEHAGGRVPRVCFSGGGIALVVFLRRGIRKKH